MLQNVETYAAVWQECLARIRNHTTEEEYARWFEPIRPLAFDGETLRLGVPDKSYVHHIEQNHLEIVRPIIAQLFGNEIRLFYAIPKNEQIEPTSGQIYNRGHVAPQIKNPFVIPGVKKLNIDPNLSLNYTFETLVVGDCNKLPVSAGKAIASSPGNNPFNPLYIYGGSGLGKTHIVQAIGNEIRLSAPDLQVLYVSMNKFQAQFTTAMKSGEINDFLHFYQTIDVLIIDDIQDLAKKPATQNSFFHIFNHLLMSGKQLILTSDKPPVELKDIEQRLITRFKWGFATETKIPDYATKRLIIELKCRRNGTLLSAEVIDYLACNITANVREIEGAISSLFAHASLLEDEITIPLVKEVLKAYVESNSREVTIEKILEIVGGYMDVPVDRICSSIRTRNVAVARQTVMYLAKEHTKLSLNAIGEAIGGRKHATVLHSYKSVVNMLETDKVYQKQIKELEQKITL